MTIEPPNRIDTIVEECVRRCIASGSPLASLASILEAVALATILTDDEFAEIKRRTVRGIAAAVDIEEPPRTIPLR